MARIQSGLLKIDSPSYLAKQFKMLPYQVKWAYDDSRFTACEKSIRVGLTYAQEFKVTRRRIIPGNGDYLHSSVTQGVALNFIRECKVWLERFKCVAKSMGEMEYSNTLDGIKERAYYIEFDNGQRIISFSSSPNNMRGFGGEVGLDEIAFHRKMAEMMKSAGGRSLWGDPVSMWSSHNGADSEWAQFLAAERLKGGASKWSIHRVTIRAAVDQGLVERINEVKGTNFTREGFLADCEAAVGSREAFAEECLCEPAERGAAAISWADIQHAQSDYEIYSVQLEGDARKGDEIDPCAEQLLESRFFELLDPSRRYSLGYDVARNGHLSSIPILETNGREHRTVMHLKMHNCKFPSQRAVMRSLFEHCGGLSGAGDKTGLGMQICEELEDLYPGRFTGVNFGTHKPHLGAVLKGAFEDQRITIPQNPDEIAYDVRGVKLKTSGIKTLYTESKNPVNPLSHCDFAWSLALAIANAEDGDAGPVFIIPAAPPAVVTPDQFTGSGWDNFLIRDNWRY